MTPPISTTPSSPIATHNPGLIVIHGDVQQFYPAPKKRAQHMKDHHVAFYGGVVTIEE